MNVIKRDKQRLFETFKDIILHIYQSPSTPPIKTKPYN